jgi:hypothetical protein
MYCRYVLYGYIYVYEHARGCMNSLLINDFALHVI